MNTLRMGLIGAGRIGRIHAESIALRVPNAKLTAIADVDLPAAKNLADQVGAETVNPVDESLKEIVMSATNGKGADVTFECAGEEATLNQAFALTKKSGGISLIGHYRKTPQFNIENLIMNSMNVFGPVSGHQFFEESVKLISEGKVDLTQLVSHKYPIEKAKEAFETASDVNESVKVLFTPGGLL